MTDVLFKWVQDVRARGDVETMLCRCRCSHALAHVYSTIDHAVPEHAIACDSQDEPTQGLMQHAVTMGLGTRSSM